MRQQNSLLQNLFVLFVVRSRVRSFVRAFVQSCVRSCVRLLVPLGVRWLFVSRLCVARLTAWPAEWCLLTGQLCKILTNVCVPPRRWLDRWSAQQQRTSTQPARRWSGGSPRRRANGRHDGQRVQRQQRRRMKLHPPQRVSPSKRCRRMLVIRLVVTPLTQSLFAIAS